MKNKIIRMKNLFSGFCFCFCCFTSPFRKVCKEKSKGKKKKERKRKIANGSLCRRYDTICFFFAHSIDVECFLYSCVKEYIVHMERINRWKREKERCPFFLTFTVYFFSVCVDLV